MIATKRKSSPPAPTAPGQSRALWALLCLLITFLLTGTRAEAFFAPPDQAPSQISPAAQETTGKTTTAWQYDALDSLIAAKRVECFPAGTPVATPDGQKPIEEIKEGDSVLAYDEATGEVVERKVWKTLKNFTHYWIDVEIEGEVVTATRTHRFWVENQSEWVEAQSLQSGMIVRLVDGRTSAVKSAKLRVVDKAEDTFNLEVTEHHNYFVGKASVLVHNGDFDPENPDFKDGRDTVHQSRRAAFREAKRASGIPTSQTHDTHRTVRDTLLPGKSVIDYEFTSPETGKTIKINDHRNGHPEMKGGGGNWGPHFNDTGKGHHIYKGC